MTICKSSSVRATLRVWYALQSWCHTSMVWYVTSVQVDPGPHYIMSAACAAGAAYSYSSLSNPRMAGIAGAFSLAYLFAGCALVASCKCPILLTG
jgi:hypothetical protein